MMDKPTITQFKKLTDMIFANYKRYIPNAFDESPTILQKLNKVIVQLNEMGLIVNEVVEKWNEVMEWILNDGITSAVKERLLEMIDDGTLAHIINVTIFEELNNKIGDINSLGDSPKSLSFNILTEGLDPKNYGAIGDGNPHYLYEYFNNLETAKIVYPDALHLNDQIDYLAIQKTINIARTTQQKVKMSKGTYLINREIKAQTVTDQEPLVIEGKLGKGSFFRPRNTVIIKRFNVQNETGYERLFYGCGHGLEIYNITFDGSNVRYDGILIDRGFELVMQNVRILDVYGRGLELNNLSNAYLNRVYVDHCGDDGDGVGAYRPAVILTGKDVAGVNEKVSNTALIDFMHIERSRTTALQVATGNSYVQKAEFCRFNDLHVEQTIDNVDQTSYPQRPAVHIGNVRGMIFVSPYIYGGGSELLRIQKWMDVGADNDWTSVSINGGDIKGYTTGGATTDNTPSRLVNIESGDYVSLDNVVLSHVRVGGTHLRISATAKEVRKDRIFINDKLGGTAKIEDLRNLRGGLVLPVINDAVNPALLGSIYIEETTGAFRGKDLNGVNHDL